MKALKKLWIFLKKTAKAAWKTFKDFTVSTVKNAPATTVLVLAACGLTSMLARLPIEAALVSVAFISEAMMVPVLSVAIIFTLAYLAGVSNGQELQYCNI